MRISFDIDDTLVCWDADVPCEPNRVPILFRPWFREPLRLGARDLLRELNRRGHSICIYTTSYRPPAYLKWWLRFYGIRISAVYNADAYSRWLDENRLPDAPSKYPPAFGIDLHVDDLEGMQQEALQHRFRVICVSPGDRSWVERVLEVVEGG